MNSEYILHSDERIDEFTGLKVIQKIDGPHFSLDAILLARFTKVKRGEKLADLGTGSGIISLIIAKETQVEKIIGIEVQDELADIARRNVRLNSLEDKIEIITEDLRRIHKEFQAGYFDIVVSNPPYRLAGSGRINPNPLKAISRHEIKCSLDDILKATSYLLKNKGKAVYVYRPDRIADIISGCRHYNLEPKRIQFVYPGINIEANLVLIEAIKNGKKESRVLSPLIISGHDIPIFQN